MSANKVMVYDGTAGSGTLKGTATVSGGTWSLSSVVLAAGMHTLNCYAGDAAGNTSGAASRKCYTGSTVTPVCDLLDDSGDSNSDNLTNDNTPRIKATLDFMDEKTALGVDVAEESINKIILYEETTPGNYTQLMESSSYPDEAVQGEVFTYTFQLVTPLSEGVHTLVATWKDSTGVESAKGASLEITIDTTAPNAPTVSLPVAGQVYVGTSITVGGSAT